MRIKSEIICANCCRQKGHQSKDLELENSGHIIGGNKSNHQKEVLDLDLVENETTSTPFPCQ